jgi:hypothetical protein
MGKKKDKAKAAKRASLAERIDRIVEKALRRGDAKAVKS